MQILIYLATQQQDMENTLLDTWAHTFGPSILEGTSKRNTWLTFTNCSLCIDLNNHVCNYIFITSKLKLQILNMLRKFRILNDFKEIVNFKTDY